VKEKMKKVLIILTLLFITTHVYAVDEMQESITGRSCGHVHTYRYPTERKTPLCAFISADLLRWDPWGKSTYIRGKISHDFANDEEIYQIGIHIDFTK
jgi:hypothetical protein